MVFLIHMQLISVGNYNVEINLVYREANECAGRLAKHGHDHHVGIVVYEYMLIL